MLYPLSYGAVGPAATRASTTEARAEITGPSARP